VDLPWPSQVVDFADVEDLSRAVADRDAVAHLAIFNDFHGMYADRRAAYDGYVGLTRRILDAANAVGARVGYVSTDWVFDGTGHLVDEDETPNPVNLYGYLKTASELVVLHRASSGFVARVGGVQGLHQTQAAGPRSQDVGFGYFVSAWSPSPPATPTRRSPPSAPRSPEALLSAVMRNFESDDTA